MCVCEIYAVTFLLANRSYTGVNMSIIIIPCLLFHMVHSNGKRR